MSKLLRPNIDHDPVVPWNWATLGAHPDPVEIVSYPIPNDGREDTIMVRMKVGDPTSLKQVPLRAIAAFAPDRHEWFYERERVYYDIDAFAFADELPPERVNTLRAKYPDLNFSKTKIWDAVERICIRSKEQSNISNIRYSWQESKANGHVHFVNGKREDFNANVEDGKAYVTFRGQKEQV